MIFNYIKNSLEDFLLPHGKHKGGGTFHLGNSLLTPELVFATNLHAQTDWISVSDGNFYENTYTGTSSRMIVAEEATVSQFSVTVYPNSYTENFSLYLFIESAERVGFMVYDMTGRLLEHRESAPSEIYDLKFGNFYPTELTILLQLKVQKSKALRMVTR